MDLENLSRRDVLRLSALAGGALLAGSLVGCDSKSAAAKATEHQPGSGDAAALRVTDGAPPVVDRLAVTVMVDNFYDALVKSAKVGTVDVVRSGLGLGPDL